MTEEKMILNDGQYDEQYDLEIKTHQISVSADVLADKGWYKLAGDEQIVKKVELTKEEAEFVEKHKRLPFYDLKEPLSYIISLHDYVDRKNVEHPRTLLAKLAQAYFNGYTIEKEKKYCIKLNFDYKYLRVRRDNGEWYWGSKWPTLVGRTQFTQSTIDEMQKDPRAKGLNLNALKVEVPEDELED